MTNAVQAEAECITVDKVKSKGGWDIVTQTPVFEPYWFADENGNFQGMDYDLLVEVNKILDIPGTRYTTVPWAGVLPALQTGKSDFVPEAIAVTKARQETFAFAYPEGDNSIMILTRPDTGIKSVEDLPGRTVGIQTGSAGETTLIKLSDDYKAAGKEPVAVKNYQHNVDVFIDLGNRRIDALMMNLAPISSYMKKYPGKFHNAGLASDHLYAAWVFRKEDMGKPGCIGTEVNKALYELREKGTIKELQLKWFGHEMKLPDYDTWVSVE
jgi:polar amino acid transport system substrate-binding protein